MFSFPFLFLVIVILLSIVLSLSFLMAVLLRVFYVVLESLYRYSFSILSFIPTFSDGVSLQDAQVFVGFISPSVLILSWFGSSISSIRCRLPLFISSMAHFSMPNSIPMSWLYILFACIRVFSSFSFLQIVWCHQCTLGDWSFLAIYLVCTHLCIFLVCS